MPNDEHAMFSAVDALLEQVAQAPCQTPPNASAYVKQPD